MSHGPLCRRLGLLSTAYLGVDHFTGQGRVLSALSAGLTLAFQALGCNLDLSIMG